MSFTIAVAGKGGTGKSTLSALILRDLLKKDLKPVLAVDADADANLADMLGLKDIQTLGAIRQEVQDTKGEIPASMDKSTYVEMRLEDVLVEQKGYDLVVMGRTEGQGCYCYVNNLLRKYLSQLNNNYPYIVIDNEAGLEHLSRHTTDNLDALIIVSDPSVKGILTAIKVKELAAELKLRVKDVRLVISRLPGDVPQALIDKAKKGGLEIFATIPYDEDILDFDLNERSILEIDDKSKAACAVSELMGKIVNQTSDVKS